jgi:prepilin-type N-terminal cleavage/methylation domain-containing protein
MNTAHSKVTNRFHLPLSDNGFTLIELLVAIAIVAIISTIGMVMYSQAQKTARDGKRIGDLQEIQKALEQYYAINQKYPGSNGDAGSYPTSVNTFFASGVAPKDPATAAPNYSYYACSNNNRYDLCATLESCGSKCNFNSAPDGCTAAPAGAVGPPNTILCKSNVSTN